MKWRNVYYTVICLLLGCSTPKEIFVTDEFRDNNRSSSIEFRFFKDYLPRLLGYQVYKDSSIAYSSKDSANRIGLITRGSSLTLINGENEMQFGNDSIQCSIRYNFFLEYETTRPPVFNLFSKNPGYDDQQTKQSLGTVNVTGTIQYPGFATAIPFTYTNHSGQLLIEKDSFKLAPVYQGPKLMKTFIGVKLLKGDTVYGTVNSFTGMMKKKAFVYTKATAMEQLLIAAYFVIISRYL
jgi:hypothetical protein